MDKSSFNLSPLVPLVVVVVVVVKETFSDDCFLGWQCLTGGMGDSFGGPTPFGGVSAITNSSI